MNDTDRARVLAMREGYVLALIDEKYCRSTAERRAVEALTLPKSPTSCTLSTGVTWSYDGARRPYSRWEGTAGLQYTFPSCSTEHTDEDLHAIMQCRRDWEAQGR